ncbi:tonB-denpendent receptor [Pandoraea sputorum]|nr:tonB-denpendent receptor [Pandoraea sputorum]
MFRVIVASFTIASVVLPAAANATCQATPVDYHYHAQRLDQALQDLAHRSGCFIHVPPDVLKGQRAHSLYGRYRPLPALKALLRGTGLDAHATADGLAVTRSPVACGPSDHDACAHSDNASPKGIGLEKR